MSWTDLPDFTELLLRLGCAVVIRLTDEGIRQIHRHEAMMNALLDSLIAEAPPEDRAAFYRTLALGLAKARTEWREITTAVSSD